MKYLVTKAQMQQYDRNTMEVYGMPPEVLIERAALAAVEELEAYGLEAHSRILLACGTGNNGADGLVMARLLHLSGHRVQVVLIGDRGHATQENHLAYQIAKNYRVPIALAEQYLGNPEDTAAYDSYDWVVDAVFGVGLSRPVCGVYRTLLEWLKALPGKKMAVDIPSGIDADDGQVLGIAFDADVTVTFSYEKIGLRLFPGQSYAGKIVCRSVGIDDYSFLANTENALLPDSAAFTEKDLSLLPKRSARTNKGSYGKVLIIAGSVNMAGAAMFGARAAYYSGCGLVRVLTPEENRVIIQAALPEAILTTYRSDQLETETIQAALQWADVVVCGPGLGMTAAAHQLVRLVAAQADVPTVFDADALNILAEYPEILHKIQAPLILTPHLGEMARLCKTAIAELQMHLTVYARKFAKEHQVICVEKDARTITALPSGQIYVNLSGNNGMATAGSGDVLTGIIAAFLAQGLPPELAAPLGVYVHGLAGDAAAARVGRYSLTASVLLEALPDILRKGEKEEYWKKIETQIIKKEGERR